MRIVDERLELLVGAEVGIDLLEVGDPVAVITRRVSVEVAGVRLDGLVLVDRADPDRGDAEVLEVGKLADFVVIPVDYMTVPAEDIWRIEPDMTVIGGEVVYTKPVLEEQ